MKILVAYDGSPSSESALDEILDRPWPAGSEVRLITVIDRASSLPIANGAEVYAPLMERIHATLREQTYQSLQGALKKFEIRSDLRTSYEIREGSAKTCLLEAIHVWQPDLVIAGCRGASGLARLFLGSVSHALVTHAPCNVEIIKIHTTKGEAA